jgi:ABC-type phosphate transport system substrate-binding protein
MHIVRLKLRKVSEQKFFVTLSDRQHQLEIEGFLPSIPDRLQSALQQWQSMYRQIERSRSSLTLPTEFRIIPKSVQNVSYAEYTNAVKIQLDRWLNCRDSQWQPIREGLIAIANQLHRESDREIQLILDTQDVELRRLPWQEWDLVEKYYPNSEIAFTTLPTKQLATNQNQVCLNSDRIRILVVVGRSDGINTKSDLEVIKQLEAKGAEVICLLQPNRKDLSEALWNENGYHIFIFTGHSSSREDGQIGWIEISNSDRIAIEEFKDAFKRAIDRGLQLAIFNSCDGLGLANQLAGLNLPQSIVMRELIPDEVAVEFLQYFFGEFTNNKSLFTSIHTAKKRLEPFQPSYPGAVWLPALCLQHSVNLLYWRELDRSYRKKSNFSQFSVTFASFKKIGIILVIGILSFALGLGVPILSPWLDRANFSNDYTTIASGGDLPPGIWQYGGSTTWEPIRASIDRKISKEHPEFKLLYTPHPTLPLGSGTGIKMLLEGQLSFVQSSRPLEDSEYRSALQRGIMLKQIPVAIDSIAFAVNPALKIEGLNLRQVRDIYTGKITNWHQLGGDDLEIIPYSRPVESGTTEFFQENILWNKKFSDRVVFVEDNDSALKQLISPENKGAIYYASATDIISNCQVKPLPISRYSKTVFTAPYRGELIVGDRCLQQHNKLNFEAFQNGEYPLTRRLFVAIAQNGQADETVGETYTNLLFTDEGQKLIKKAGFIPMRAF